MNQNPESDWFGYTHLSPEEKTARVGSVFSSVAKNYDLMNDLMSGGMHRLWKNHFVAKMNPRAGEIILDVAGGTGDIALRCAKATQNRAAITVCDINQDMLVLGKDKAIDSGFLSNLGWVVGNAEALPFASRSIDLLCISFGLRNVTYIDTALHEFARILKRGGRFYCMEFSPDVISPFKKIYDLYSFSVLPWLGEKVANDRVSYQYLAESIRQFPDPKTLENRMKKAGFDNICHENLMGGIAALHSGWIL